VLLAEQFNRAGNAIRLQLDKQGVKYRLKENAFVHVEDPEALQNAAQSLDGRAILNRINHCLPALLTQPMTKRFPCATKQKPWIIALPLEAIDVAGGDEPFLQIQQRQILHAIKIPPP
jgi:hypothetical protein